MEKVLNKAIARVKNGEDISTVVLSYPEKFRSELESALKVASLAYSIHSREVPTPIRRKLFLEAKQQNIFVSFFEFYKVSASTVAITAILVVSTAFAAASSLPGDKLFVLKKGYENAQLRLTTNPTSKTNLALNFANSRLHDAEQVLSNPSDSSSQQQALEEANTQTQVAIDSIQQNPNPSAVLKDPSVINNLKNLAQTQSNLVAQLPANQSSSAAAQTAKQSVGVVQDLIAAATGGNQGSNLPADKIINISGTITAMGSNSITVDKNVYNFEPEGLTVLDNTKSKISIKSLQIGETVTVQGTVQNDKNIAQTIIINSVPQSTNNTSNNGSNNANSGSASSGSNNQIVVPSTVSEPAMPNDVIGTFIPETANLQ